MCVGEFAKGELEPTAPVPPGPIDGRVNEKLQVLDTGGAPIDGLYAAGSAGQGGVPLEGHGHHLAWAFTSGRLAGRYAAEEAASIK